ncbi:MAG: hypothetical protein JXD18_13080, partial [Anaerolineae bacterium]|nr:hypothetical protein [Anaerolineae bacterium]
MSSASPWPERFYRLAQAIVTTAAPEEMSPSLTCQECQDNMDLLVIDDLAGRVSFQQHLALLAHLTECKTCRSAYLILRDLLSEGTTPPLPAERPSVSTRPGDWMQSLLPLTFEVVHESINRALRGPQLAAMRGDASAEDEEHRTLAYIDALLTEHEDLIVEVSVLRSLAQP